MKESDKMLMAAGVPEPLWADSEKTIEFLARKVIALSEQVGGETLIIDEERLMEVEDRVYNGIMNLNNMDVFKQYNKSFLLTLSETDRVATKAALARFANERNVQPMEHWV
jgi:hypothetical protein